MKQHWQVKLSSYLMNPKAKIAFIGIGNSRMGDDGAGLRLAQQLQSILPEDRFLVIEGGLAPENCTGELREFCPNLVMLLDAVHGLGRSGMIQWLYAEQIDGFSASSHSLPLSMLAAYLKAEYHCEVYVLAITAQSLETDTALSEYVEGAVEELCHYIEGLVSSSCS